MCAHTSKAKVWDFVWSKYRTRISHDTSEKASLPVIPQPTHLAIRHLNSVTKKQQAVPNHLSTSRLVAPSSDRHTCYDLEERKYLGLNIRDRSNKWKFKDSLRSWRESHDDREVGVSRTE